MKKSSYHDNLSRVNNYGSHKLARAPLNMY